MTEQALRKMIAAGESTRQEFKSWVKCKDYRQRKELAVKSAVALANTKGGVLLFGVEDDGTITGCPKSDPQALIAFRIVCLGRRTQMVCQYGIGLSFLYHGCRYERFLLEEPECAFLSF